MSDIHISVLYLIIYTYIMISYYVSYIYMMPHYRNASNFLFIQEIRKLHVR